jgi:CRP-like cAMP-binding protein
MSDKIEFTQQSFDGESLIFDEGDKGDSLYLITNGSVEIRKMRDDVQQTLTTLGKGDIFGEMALFDGRPRAAAAHAVMNTDVLVLSKSDFDVRVTNMDPVISSIVEYMIMRVRSMTDEFMRRAAEDQKKTAG